MNKIYLVCKGVPDSFINVADFFDSSYQFSTLKEARELTGERSEYNYLFRALYDSRRKSWRFRRLKTEYDIVLDNFRKRKERLE